MAELQPFIGHVADLSCKVQTVYALAPLKARAVQGAS